MIWLIILGLFWLFCSWIVYECLELLLTLSQGKSLFRDYKYYVFIVLGPLGILAALIWSSRVYNKKIKR